VRQALRRADAIIAISRATATDLIEYYRVDPAKIRVIYQGVTSDEPARLDPEQKAVLRRRWDLPEKFVLFVGTLAVHKNVASLAKAYLRISDPTVGLVIAGKPGDGLAELEAVLRGSDRRSKIRLLGYVGEEDIQDLYQLATIFVCPSFYEGFGLPVLEAMRHGLPVVCSDTSSLREVFGGSAILANPNDPPAIAHAIEGLLSDEDLRTTLVQRGAQTVQRHSWERTAKATISLYEELL
jgi:glycosyltransferase involved in cell wall biosynthesis